MTQDQRRITLILRTDVSPERGWNDTSDSSSRLIFVKGLAVLQYALSTAVTELDRDVQRVILDHSVTDAQFLDLLATLPSAFHGDVVMVRPNDSGFLSAAGRGGDRVLYALSDHDLQFYFATHDLTGIQQLIEAA